jgi:hypothetical protein
VVLIERISDLSFLAGDGNGVKGLFQNGFQQHVPPRRHDLAQGHVANRPQFWIHKDHMIELFRQMVRSAHEINGIADVPEFWCHHDFALHQTSGGKLRKGQGLPHRGGVSGLQRVKDRLLLRRAEVLDKVDHVIGVEFSNRLGQHLRREDRNHVFAQRLVQFRQDLPIELFVVQADQPPPIK